jgi:Histidine phosphatase superfamily (branch 1)
MHTIGLVRHFPVPHSKYALMNSRGFEEWTRWYDTFDVPTPESVSPYGGWDICYCSNLPRAAKTARKVYPGEPIENALLREVPFDPLFKTRIPLPVFAWEALSRVGWNFEHASQRETRKQTFARIAEFFEPLEAQYPGGKVLLVCHGYLMRYMQTYLHKRGYQGKVPLHPQGGVLYPFRKASTLANKT